LRLVGADPALDFDRQAFGEASKKLVDAGLVCVHPRIRRPAAVIRSVATSAVARHHALGARGRKPGAVHLRDREAVREHERFGAAVAAGGEQFERAAVELGRALGAAVMARRRHRWVATLIYPIPHRGNCARAAA